jgi:hypothetical protein
LVLGSVLGRHGRFHRRLQVLILQQLLLRWLVLLSRDDDSETQSVFLL